MKRIYTIYPAIKEITECLISNARAPVINQK